MKKINFSIILLAYVVSIATFFYIDVLEELIVRTASSGAFVEVTKLDILGIILVTLVYGILPSWAMAYGYSKIQVNNWWVVFIGVSYTIVWIGISSFLMGEYITYFGNTWLGSEILSHTMHQDHFFLAYFLSLAPLIMLGIFNRRRIR